MGTIDVVEGLTREKQGKKNIPKTGFHTNPERINKKGAPEKEWTWRSLLAQAAEEVAEGSKEPKKKLMARKLVDLCVNGDVAALKEFGNRRDGMPKQQLEHTGEDGGPIEQNITVTLVRPDDEHPDS